MKKAFIALLFFAILSLLSTLYPISRIEDARERLHTEQVTNKVVNSSWPWLPMVQFDKYRPLFDIDNKFSEETINELKSETERHIVKEFINKIKKEKTAP